jgi:ABC-type nitrate/sulfonate/bicarbonate transport system substrate-binding protein
VTLACVEFQTGPPLLEALNADAAAAFRDSSIDAQAIWDPFYAQTELIEKVRVLITAERVTPANSFILAQRDYAAHHPDIIAAAIRDIDAVSRWSEDASDEGAPIISGLTDVDIAGEYHPGAHRLRRRLPDRRGDRPTASHCRPVLPLGAHSPRHRHP